MTFNIDWIENYYNSFIKNNENDRELICLPLNHSFALRQVDWFKAGSALNLFHNNDLS